MITLINLLIGVFIAVILYRLYNKSVSHRKKASINCKTCKYSKCSDWGWDCEIVSKHTVEWDGEHKYYSACSEKNKGANCKDYQHSPLKKWFPYITMGVIALLVILVIMVIFIRCN